MGLYPSTYAGTMSQCQPGCVRQHVRVKLLDSDQTPSDTRSLEPTSDCPTPSDTVRYWSDTDQTLSDTRSLEPTSDCQTLSDTVRYWSDADQTLSDTRSLEPTSDCQTLSDLGPPVPTRERVRVVASRTVCNLYWYSLVPFVLCVCLKAKAPCIKYCTETARII